MFKLNKSTIDSLAEMDRKLKIRVLRILAIDSKVTPDEIKAVVSSFEVFGKIIADNAVKETIDTM